jgi:hypothetical protein
MLKHSTSRWVIFRRRNKGGLERRASNRGNNVFTETNPIDEYIRGNGYRALA